ncbi:MAG: hypothetical protein IH600_15100 [Bacteroidetes bacterium]|nr:hypothetical protein [Bacteroidota bacterium]
MTPNEVISIAANNCSDGGMVLLAQEEYLAFLNDVAYDIWFESKAMHAIRQYALPEGEQLFTFPDTDIIQFVELQLREGTPAAEEDGEQPIYDSTANPIHVEEKPVHQNIREGLGIFRNLGQRHTHRYFTVEFRNGQFVILVPRPFEANQYLQAHCVITGEMYQILDLWDEDLELTTANTIWEPFRNVFIEGVTWRAARRLSNHSKDPTRRQIWNDSQNLYYSRYLPDAINYVHQFKDGSSVMMIRASRFLEE